MKSKIRTIVAGIMLTFCCAATHAQNAPDSPAPMLAFAQSHNCMSCHSMSRNFMGPSFGSVARKYAHVEGAQKQLARKIVEGGVGVWGIVPMPANTQVSPDQALALADWILSLDKQDQLDKPQASR
jgi:cytochrome c